MLKGISPIISPELLKVIAEMGHGDTLVIGDANFAAAGFAKAGPAESVLVRADGVKATELLDAILQLFPLDGFIEKPVTLMDKDHKLHADLECPVWDEYKSIVAKYDERGAKACRQLDRFDFYEEAKKAYSIVATTESAFYACIIIQKGAI